MSDISQTTQAGSALTQDHGLDNGGSSKSSTAGVPKKAAFRSRWKREAIHHARQQASELFLNTLIQQLIADHVDAQTCLAMSLACHSVFDSHGQSRGHRANEKERPFSIGSAGDRIQSLDGVSHRDRIHTTGIRIIDITGQFPAMNTIGSCRHIFDMFPAAIAVQWAGGQVRRLDYTSSSYVYDRTLWVVAGTPRTDISSSKVDDYLPDTNPNLRRGHLSLHWDFPAHHMPEDNDPLTTFDLFSSGENLFLLPIRDMTVDNRHRDGTIEPLCRYFEIGMDARIQSLRKLCIRSAAGSSSHEDTAIELLEQIVQHSQALTELEFKVHAAAHSRGPSPLSTDALTKSRWDLLPSLRHLTLTADIDCFALYEQITARSIRPECQSRTSRRFEPSPLPDSDIESILCPLLRELNLELYTIERVPIMPEMHSIAKHIVRLGGSACRYTIRVLEKLSSDLNLGVRIIANAITASIDAVLAQRSTAPRWTGRADATSDTGPGDGRMITAQA